MDTKRIFTKLEEARNLLTGKYKLDIENIFKIRKELHKHPEVGFETVETKKRLINYLSTRCKISSDKIRSYAKNGFTYDIKGKAPSKGADRIIGFRADIDALPMKELSTFPYASVNENAAHMCGHDGHMVTLLSLATVLSDHLGSMPSNKAVRLVFQPAEEGGHGGEVMVKEGALDGVSEIYALHSWSLPLGKFGIRKSGAMTTGMIRFRIDVRGVGSHGAYPENGRDPITAICQINAALHTILSRRIPRKEMAVCTIGQIRAGDTENVIPDFATMGGSIRTEKAEIAEEIKKQMSDMVKYIAKAVGCEGEARYIEETPAVMNAKEPAAALREAVKEVMGEEFLCEEGMNASEDFCYMTEKVPGGFMLIGHAVPGKEVIMNHSPYFDYNEDLIAPAVLAWIKLIENRLEFKLC